MRIKLDDRIEACDTHRVMQIKSATNDTRITNIEDLSHEKIGSLYLTVDCDIDTPADAVLAACADFLGESLIEECSLGHRRRYGAFLVGWVYTIRAWRPGARSTLATGYVEDIA